MFWFFVAIMVVVPALAKQYFSFQRERLRNGDIQDKVKREIEQLARENKELKERLHNLELITLSNDELSRIKLKENISLRDLK